MEESLETFVEVFAYVQRNPIDWAFQFKVGNNGTYLMFISQIEPTLQLFH